MSNLAHPQFATPSWQGNYDVYSVGPGEDTKLISISLEAAASDLTLNDTFQFIKLSSETIVLGGWLTTDAIDSGGTACVIDIGYDPDTAAAVTDFFVNGSAASARNVPFTVGIGAATAPFVPDSGDDYFVTGLVQTAPTTAAAGTITVTLLLGHAQAYT